MTAPVRRAFCALLLLLATVLRPVPSRADSPPVVLVCGTEAGAAPAGFVEALSIQLVGAATVRVGAPMAGSVPEKLASLREPLRQQKARAAMWLEGADIGAQRQFLVYVASERDDRVLVQVVRLPGPEGPETWRALALKVREVMETVLAAGVERAVVPATNAPSPPTVSSPAASSIPPLSPTASSRSEPLDAPRRALWPVVEAAATGAAFASGTAGSQYGARLGVGGQRVAGRWRVEGALRAGCSSGQARSQGGASAETSELDASAGVRLLADSGRLQAGLLLGGGARVVRAEGKDADGRGGAVTRVVPVVYVGPEGRVKLSDGLALRAMAGVELAWKEQRFLVLGQPVIDVGMQRAMFELGLVFAAP